MQCTLANFGDPCSDDSEDGLQVVVHLSNRQLSETEYRALNHGLQFGILPTKFNFNEVQAEFENLYRQVRPHLQHTKRVLFKTKLMNLYNKYKSTYFYDKSHGKIGMPQDEMQALKALKEDEDLIICKPDKGQGMCGRHKQTRLSSKNENNIK